MKNDYHTETLLNDVIKEGSFEELNSQAKSKALKAFHRHQRIRKTRPFVAICFVAWAACLLILNEPWVRKQRHEASISSPPRTEVVGISPEIKMISDEELLSFFPSNSCRITELDGEQFFVILDPELRDKLLDDSKSDLQQAGE